MANVKVFMKQTDAAADTEAMKIDESLKNKTKQNKKNKIGQTDILLRRIKLVVMPLHPNASPSPLEGRCSPQEDIDSELFISAGRLVVGHNLCIEPEAPLVWRLHVVVDHHTHAHLELVPPQ